MADTGIKVQIDFPDLRQLRYEFSQLPTNIAAKHLGAALRKSIQPGLSALRQNTPKGPTGNLRKSIGLKVKTYPKNGTAVALVGYQIGGDSKGYHQGFLEFGTKERKTKGRFASSFKQPSSVAGVRGGFRVVVPTRGANKGKLRTVSPNHPKSFFKSAKAGETVSLGKMPIGGRFGRPPVKTAFEQTQGAQLGELESQMAVSLERALKELVGRAKRGLITDGTPQNQGM
jgi:hypothetical protein